MDDSFVPAKDIALLVHEVSRFTLSAGFSCDKARVIMIWHEADILTVTLMCHRKSCLLCDLSDLVFFIEAHRHQCAGKLLLCQIVKGIGLVFGGCDGILYGVSAIWKLLDAGIVACCDVICSDFQRTLQQGFPFHIAVAGITWVGSVAPLVFLNKVIYDVFLEILLKVHDIIGNIKYLSYPSSIIHRRQSTAAALLLPLEDFLVLPDLHGDTDDIIALFF